MRTPAHLRPLVIGHWSLVILALCATLPAHGQQATVSKSLAAATLNQITGDLSFGTGKTGTFLSGSTLTLSGSLGGTPTGGTLNLSALTLTLPATVSGGGSSFQPLDSDLTAIAALTTTANGRGLLTASALTAAGLGLTNGATLDTIGAKTQTGTGDLVLSVSPAFTGSPTALTPASTENSTRLATTAFAQSLLTGSNTGSAQTVQNQVTLAALTSGFVIGTPAVTGSNGSAATYILGGAPIAEAGYLNAVKIYASGAGTAKLKRFTQNGLVFTFVSETTLTLASGANNFVLNAASTPLPYIAVNKGDVMAVYSDKLVYNSVTQTLTPYYSTGSDVTTTYTASGTPSTSIQLSIEIDYTTANAPTTAYLTAQRNNYGASFYAGPATPATKSNYLSESLTYVEPSKFAFDSRLDRVTVYSAAAGQMLVMILSASGANIVTLGSFPLALATGTNAYVAGTDFPSGLTIPTGGWIAFRPLTANTLPYDVFSAHTYNTFFGYPAATNTAFFGTFASGTAQIRFDYTQPLAVRGLTDRKPTVGTWSFASAIDPQLVATNWSISGGFAVPSATGITNNISGDNSTMAFYDSRLRAVFKFTGGSDEIGFMRDPKGTSSAVGSVLTINRSTGLIAFRAGIGAASSGLTSVTQSKTTSLTLATNRLYRVDFYNANWFLYMEITDLTTGLSDTMTRVVVSDTACGHGAGVPGFFAVTGAPAVQSMALIPAQLNPPTMIFGDSITQGSQATTNTSGYAATIATAVGGLVSAASGEHCGQLNNRLGSELAQFNPKYALILDLTNYGLADTALATVQTAVNAAVATCLARGVTPIIGCPPPLVGHSVVETDYNPWIKSSGYAYIPFDQVLTTGGTGLSADLIAAAFAVDLVHPNDTGYALMVKAVKAYYPEIFEQVGASSVP